MQRLVTILVSVGLVAIAVTVRDPSWVGVVAALDAVPIGLVLGAIVFALLVGEVIRLLRLPRLLGYAAVGLAYLPAVRQVVPGVRAGTLDAAAYFSDFTFLYGISLGLAGLAVGLHVDLRSLKNHASEVLGFGISHLLVVPLVLLGALSFIAPRLTSFAGGDLWAWAPLVVLALVAATTSPVALHGVDVELRADDSFTSVQIHTAFFKAAVVLGLVLVALSLEGSGGGIDPTSPATAWVTEVVLQVGLAVLLGVLGGVVLLGVFRYLPREALTVSITGAILTAVMLPGTAPGLFVGGLVAGVIAQSGSRYSFTLTEQLDRLIPLVHAVLFVFLMGSLPLPDDAPIWAWGLCLVLARVAAMALASRLAGWLLRANEVVTFQLSYAMVPQGPAAFYLLAFVGFHVPDWAPYLKLYVPVFLVEFALGVILHRYALLRSGLATVGDAQPRPVTPPRGAEPTGEAARHGAEAEGTGPAFGPLSLLPEPRFEPPAFQDDKLSREVEKVRQRVLRLQDLAVDEFFAPHREFVDHILDDAGRRLRAHTRATAEDLRSTEDPVERAAALRARRHELEDDLQELLGTFGPFGDTERLNRMIRMVLEAGRRACRVRQTMRVPEEPHHSHPRPTDSRYVRLRKATHRLLAPLGPRPTRVVALRTLADHFIADGLARDLRPAVHLIGRSRIFLWRRIEILYDDLARGYDEMLEHLGPARPRPSVDADAERRRADAELAAFDRRLLADPAESAPASHPSVDASPEHLEVNAPLLEEPESPEPASGDPILAFWLERSEHLGVRLRDTRRDVHVFQDDTRRRFALGLAQSFRGFRQAAADAGTFLLPARRVEAWRRDERGPQRQRERIFEAMGRWSLVTSAHVDRRSMQLHFRDLEARMRRLIDDTITTVSRELGSHLTYYPAETTQRCDEVARVLAETIDADASAADLSDALIQIRETLATFLQDDALHSLHELRETGRFTSLIRDFIEQITRIVDRQPDVFRILDISFYDLPETAGPWSISTFEVPYHTILDALLIQACYASLNELDLRVRAIIERTAAGLAEIHRVISFNLDAAATELRAPSEGAGEAAGAKADEDAEMSQELVAEFSIGGIRRAGQQASQLLEETQRQVDAIEAELVDTTLDHLRSARERLFAPESDQLVALVREVTREHTDRVAGGRAALIRLRERSATRAAELTAPLRERVRQAHDYLQLGEGTREELVEDVGRASFDVVAREELPAAYRRLFTPVPVEMPELFVARPAAHAAFGAAVRRWRQGRRVGIAITGPLGIGKTSFVHRQLAEQLGETPMLRWNIRERLTTGAEVAEGLSALFGMRRIRDPERLANALSDLPGPRVVVVDDIERLYLRAPGGATGLRAFLTVVTRSPRQIMWVITANDALWSFIDTMIGISDAFTDCLSLQPLDDHELEGLVFRRHDVSGFEMALPGAEAGDTDRRDRARRRVVEQLHQASGGHPLLALYYWLSAVDAPAGEDGPGRDEHGLPLRLRPIQPLRTDYVRHLDDDKLLGLGQFLIHEELTEREYARIMGQSDQQARRDLAYFEGLNFIRSEPGRQFEFRINEILHGALHAALREHNII